MKTIVLGGFLGSGKTTVLLQLAKYLTQLPGEPQVVILENEIGEVGVDNQMLGGSAMAVENVFSGCICCSGAVDLLEAVRTIREQYDPAWLLIEATGVALPSSIRDNLARYFEIKAATLTIADASRWTRIKKVSPDFSVAQVADADVVMLTKIDKIDAEAASAIEADLKACSPEASVYPVNALKPIDPKYFEELMSKSVEA